MYQIFELSNGSDCKTVFVYKILLGQFVEDDWLYDGSTSFTGRSWSTAFVLFLSSASANSYNAC